MMEWLGRGGNVIPVATGKHISLANAAGVTFVCYEDGGAQSITFKQSLAGANEADINFLNHYYASNGIGGVWTRETADASAALSDDTAMTKKDTTAFDCAVIYVPAEALGEAYDSVECTVDAGVCVAIVHDLYTQRAPENLPASAV